MGCSANILYCCFHSVLVLKNRPLSSGLHSIWWEVSCHLYYFSPAVIVMIFSLSLVFKDTVFWLCLCLFDSDVFCCSFLWILTLMCFVVVFFEFILAWDSLRFLDLHVYFFFLIFTKIFSHHIFRYYFFLPQFSPLLSFWYSNFTCIIWFQILLFF